jgi:SAM-dependent methyltransferase
MIEDTAARSRQHVATGRPVIAARRGETVDETRSGSSAFENARRCWDPHVRALLAFESGDENASITVLDDLGDVESYPAAWFFRSEEELPALEVRALELCRGGVLDVGAGAGCHSLVLQQRGHSVCAVEILPEMIELLRRRDVRDARTGSVFHPPAGRWDTVLMLMNGWGLPGTLAGLERFLFDVDRLVAPGGQIIADSTDMRHLASDTSTHGDTRPPLREDGRYVGEIQFQLEFAGRRGDPFSQLYVDPDTLTALARQAGWKVEIVERGEHGHFLSRLRRSGEGTPADVPSGTWTRRERTR